MNFEECIKSGTLTETGRKDLNKVEELLSLAEHKLSFWEEVKNKGDKYPTLFLEGHYEIIKELVVAILTLDGWRSDSHDCLFQYLLENKKELELNWDYLT